LLRELEQRPAKGEVVVLVARSAEMINDKL